MWRGILAALIFLKPFLKPVLKFAGTATLIFALLFSITNAQAYAKILLADLQAAQEARLAALPVEQAQILESDPWTGERNSAHAYFEKPIAALEEAVIRPENGIVPLNLAVSTYDNWLRIPAIDVNTHWLEPTLGLEALQAKDWNTLEDQIRSSLLQGPVHYPGTALPGEMGNVFITGHSSNVFWESSTYNTVFALLPKLKEGDDIFITFNQREYHYRVISKREVYPDNVSILEQGENKQLTLMTCSPVGTNLRRLVVTADLVAN